MQTTHPEPSPDSPKPHRTGVYLFNWLALGLLALTLLMVVMGIILAMFPGTLGEP